MDNKGTKYGIIAGVGLMLYFLLFYFYDKTTMMGTTVSWTSLLIIFSCAFVAVNQQRNQQAGIIAFKDALKTAFLVIVLSNLIFYLFFYILLNSDTELVTILQEINITNFKWLSPEEQWPDIEKSFENFNFGLSEAIFGFAKSTIGGFFIALLIAFLMKRSTTRAEVRKEAT